MRAAESVAADYRSRPFCPPQLDANELTRVDVNLALLKRKGVYPYEYATERGILLQLEVVRHQR